VGEFRAVQQQVDNAGGVQVPKLAAIVSQQRVAAGVGTGQGLRTP
jgi:hypothetical protein